MWLDVAKKYLGTQEVVGPENNPIVVKMFSDVGFPEVHDDETAWCAAFVGSVLKEDGQAYLKSLSARSYLNYGKELSEPQEGCIVVFWRGSPTGWLGHVGFVTRWDDENVWVIGGNQNNQVSEKQFSRNQVLGFRYPNVISPTVSTTTQVVAASSKLGVLQGIRRFITWIGASVGALFTMDSFNVASSAITQIKSSVEANLLPIAIGSAVLIWGVMKWIEYRHVKDFTEGRYIPSGMKETKEVSSDELS